MCCWKGEGGAKRNVGWGRRERERRSGLVGWGRQAGTTGLGIGDWEGRLGKEGGEKWGSSIKLGWYCTWPPVTCCVLCNPTRSVPGRPWNPGVQSVWEQISVGGKQSESETVVGS
jgi:hypothetical protein